MAVILASGGMDSCVTIAIAARDFEIALLHVNYGQRTESRELQAFRDVADFYGVPDERRLIVSIEHLARIGGSSLTDRRLEVADAREDSTGIPATYVPFRNANLLGIAVSWAEVLGAEAVFIGAVEEDSSGYPDCRRVFYDAFQSVIETGTKFEHPLRIVTPLIDMSKADIVRLGVELGAPLHLTWSCYKNEERACGACESCMLRLRGFRLAGIEDRIPYAERQGG
jgi:7-cyano-7-deazaguanine synthase